MTRGIMTEGTLGSRLYRKWKMRSYHMAKSMGATRHPLNAHGGLETNYWKKIYKGHWLDGGWPVQQTPQNVIRSYYIIQRIPWISIRYIIKSNVTIHQSDMNFDVSHFRQQHVNQVRPHLMGLFHAWVLSISGVEFYIGWTFQNMRWLWDRSILYRIWWLSG